MESSSFPLTLMEAGFKIIPGKESEFFELQNRMVPIGMAQPGFVAVYGGPILESDWLYFSVRFANPQQMHDWHQQRGHQAVQRMAYDKFWTAMYIRKWQRPESGPQTSDRFLCETRIERDQPLTDAEAQALKAKLALLTEFDAKSFETLTNQYEPQPYQFVGPLEIAPASAPVAYSLVTHWSSSSDASKWQESSSYGEIRALGNTMTETFIPYTEPEKRQNLRSDRLQRDWTLNS